MVHSPGLGQEIKRFLSKSRVCLLDVHKKNILVILPLYDLEFLLEEKRLIKAHNLVICSGQTFHVKPEVNIRKMGDSFVAV